MTKTHADLPPSVHLKMALDFLYARAMQLDLPETALLIGTAAMSAEHEARANKEQDRERPLPLRVNG